MSQIDTADEGTPQLLNELFEVIKKCVGEETAEGVASPCFWDASRFRAARIQIQFAPTLTRSIGRLLELVVRYVVVPQQSIIFVDGSNLYRYYVLLASTLAVGNSFF